jgi:hypothetical protein
VRARLTVLIVILAFAIAALPGSAPAGTQAPRAAQSRVPYGFVGMDADGPLLTSDNHLNLSRQLDTMVASGVDSLRVAFNWAAAQPYKSWTDVPLDQATKFVDVGGVPTNFAAADAIVGLAAQRGLTVLPTVLYAPDWDAGANRIGLAPPKTTGPYAAFLTALVHRYGPHGTFWSGTTGTPLPVRMWQIWNEPNLTYYWPQPFVRSYVKLLGAAHDAIKQADPGARVVLGALTNFAWKYLVQIEKVPGARREFDVISVNGFTSTPSNEILYLQLVRRAANRAGDGSKPILATEVSWPSAQGKSPQHFDWNTTEAGQARDITALLPLLAANREQLGLMGFYYYTWMSEEFKGAPAFQFAGLFRFRKNGQVNSKPAYDAFRRSALALERCRQKARVATRCAKAK